MNTHKGDRFWVEKWHDVLGWRAVDFASSNAVQYCHGYLDAMDSLYPSAKYRICKRDSPSNMKVLRETGGRGEVHTN